MPAGRWPGLAAVPVGILIVIAFVAAAYANPTSYPSAMSQQSTNDGVSSSRAQPPSLSQFALDANSNGSSSDNYSSCLIKVPYTASITGSGTSVLFSNGAQETIPSLSLCSLCLSWRILRGLDRRGQSAVHCCGERFALRVRKNDYANNLRYGTLTTTFTCTGPNTILANGSEISGCPTPISQLGFVLYSSNQTISPCPGAPVPLELGGIGVSIPLNATGAPILTNLTVSKESGDLNSYLCIETTTPVTSVAYSSNASSSGNKPPAASVDGTSMVSPDLLATMAIVATAVIVAAIYSVNARRWQL
jgi:hypothetical protein